MDLCQNIYRSVTRNSLKILYGENEKLLQQIRTSRVSAFLLVTDVIPTFKIQFPAEGKPALRYFEEIYIGDQEK